MRRIKKQAGERERGKGKGIASFLSVYGLSAIAESTASARDMARAHSGHLWLCEIPLPGRRKTILQEMAERAALYCQRDSRV